MGGNLCQVFWIKRKKLYSSTQSREQMYIYQDLRLNGSLKNTVTSF